MMLRSASPHTRAAFKMPSRLGADWLSISSHDVLSHSVSRHWPVLSAVPRLVGSAVIGAAVGAVVGTLTHAR